MMKRATRLLICILMMVLLVSGACASGFTQNGDQIEEATKSVLKLFIYEEENVAADEYTATASGFVAFSSSMLITNYHVIDGAVEIWAVDDQNNVYQLKYVLAADKDADIAILEFLKPTGLLPLELYPDDHLKRGSSIIAIGSPKETKNTVSRGIISNVYYGDIPEIQIDAAISPGSSGGALFNDDGKVIGVTTAGYRTKDQYGDDTGAQNINFATNIAVPQAMYNAWDGSRYSFKEHPDSARMDYTSVYKVRESDGAIIQVDENSQPEELLVTNTVDSTWICVNCGTINTERFCMECGAERPNWICSCGRANSGKFCISCGLKAEELVTAFDAAMTCISEQKYDEAIMSLEVLAAFDSGSYETSKGSHTVAKSYIPMAYYQKGISLAAVDGDHEEILNCFKKAGDYEDAKEQIDAENNRYYGMIYSSGMKAIEDADYLSAIDLFNKLGNYSDASEKLKEAYYLYGVNLLDEGKWEGCRSAFKKAGDYGDSATMILKSYYSEGFEWLEKGETSIAIRTFEKANDYPGAAEQIAVIKERLNSDTYAEAVRLYNDGHYTAAKLAFEKVPGYQDADNYAKKSEIGAIRVQYEQIKSIDDASMSKFESLINGLDSFLDMDEAVALRKELYYKMGIYYANSEKPWKAKAITCLKEADDYSDAPQVLMEVKISYYNDLVKGGMFKSASEFLNEELIPFGYDQDYFVMRVGDSGEVPEYIMSLIRILEIGRNIPRNETEYKEGYVDYVKILEENFGLISDGMISAEEYVYLQDLIYRGATGERVQQLVEKLFDMGYLRSLEKDHTTYVNSYYNGIKNAEKELEQNEDGVVTPEEFEKIMAQEVEISKPENVKAQINKNVATITWSRVPGAISYEVYENTETDRVKLGETKECRWVQKDIETGVTKNYIVVAKKYTIESEESVSVYAEKYYVPISIKEIYDNYEKYVGKYVEIKNAPFFGWQTVYNNPGNNGVSRSRHYNDFRSMQNDEGYDLYILCKSGSFFVLFELKDYAGWGWDNTTNDLASQCYYGKINYFSGKGVVSDKKTDCSYISTQALTVQEWDNIMKTPTIILEMVNGKSHK